MKLIHVGKKLPKELINLGWREKSAMHIGHGCWIISAEREAQTPKKKKN